MDFAILIRTSIIHGSGRAEAGVNIYEGITHWAAVYTNLQLIVDMCPHRLNAVQKWFPEFFRKWAVTGAPRLLTLKILVLDFCPKLHLDFRQENLQNIWNDQFLLSQEEWPFHAKNAMNTLFVCRCFGWAGTIVLPRTFTGFCMSKSCITCPVLPSSRSFLWLYQKNALVAAYLASMLGFSDVGAAFPGSDVRRGGGGRRRTLLAGRGKAGWPWHWEMAAARPPAR